MDIWVMEMEITLNKLIMMFWKVISEMGNSKEENITCKMVLLEILSPVYAAEIHMLSKEIWEAIRTRFGVQLVVKKDMSGFHQNTYPQLEAMVMKYQPRLQITKFLRSVTPSLARAALTRLVWSNGAYSNLYVTSSNNIQEEISSAGFADEISTDAFRLKKFYMKTESHFDRECPSKGQMMERKETPFIKIKELDKKGNNQNVL
ncbi:hypothetical protein Tco_0597417 [Tanacetum coccineum]